MPKATILFADNDPDFLDTRAEFLEQAGYRVRKAYTLEQAREVLTEAHVHLAILDIRMEDDDDEKDISGLILAKDPIFRPIPKIILTAFPTYQAVREALGPALGGLPPAVDFIAKQEGPEVLLQALERVFAQHVRIHWDLEIRWGEKPPAALVSLTEPELPAERLPDRVEEVEDLLRKLFYDFEQVVLGRTLVSRGNRSSWKPSHTPRGLPEQHLPGSSSSTAAGLGPSTSKRSASEGFPRASSPFSPGENSRRKPGTMPPRPAPCRKGIWKGPSPLRPSTGNVQPRKSSPFWITSWRSPWLRGTRRGASWVKNPSLPSGGKGCGNRENTSPRRKWPADWRGSVGKA
ncbi:MAG: response regulator [Chloroflexia bacterium]